MTYKPTILIDFDGVIHSYSSGWQGATTISDPPVPGVFADLTRYMERFSVCIYSSRSREAGGIEAMKNWFRQHGFTRVDDLAFPSEKPAAFLTIDDRCICFDGTLPSIEAIDSFRPWNKRES